MTVPSFCTNHPSSKYNASKYNAVLSTHSGYSLPFTQMLRGLSERPLISISILLFCSTGIIFVGQLHPYPALFHRRDYFAPVRCIPICLFCTAGIIFAGQLHLYLAFLFHRDYFRRSDSSLSCTFSPQGLLCPGQLHLQLPLLHHRDYFGRPDSSLFRSFVPQGLFSPASCIPILHFFTTGITLPRSDTSPLAESISASPFRQLPAFREAPCLRGASSAFRFHAHKQPALIGQKAAHSVQRR